MKLQHNYKIGNVLCTAQFDNKLESVSQYVHPHTFVAKRDHIDSVSKEVSKKITDFDEAKHLIGLLTQDILSGIHFKSLFEEPLFEHIPHEMVDYKKLEAWAGVANLISCFSHLFGIEVVSYLSENSGNLFVHLVPKRGTDFKAVKSRKNMRGHTDGVIFPLNGHEDGDAELPPGPDIVILIAINNPNKVPTRLVPLDEIIGGMQPESIRQLRERKFLIEPQLSFDLDGVTRTYQPVLTLSEETGYLMRYSHSKVTPMNKSDKFAVDAISDLQAAIQKSSNDIILNSGDVLFVNNRTSIHGRGTVDLSGANTRRWLIRTYGQTEINDEYCLDDGRPFQLHRK